MKLGWFLPILLLCGLIAVPDQAVGAASEAAVLWWTCVLPSLLPYLITASLLEKSDLLLQVPKRLLPLFLWMFGAVGGYPIGAKLCERLRCDGVLSEADAGFACAFSNQPNPVFVVSVVALGIFRSSAAIAPLLIGIYGVSLFGLIPLFRLGYNKPDQRLSRLTFANLPPAIESGVRSILVICGCMVFASVLGSLFKAAGIPHAIASAIRVDETAVHACLLGLFEMSCGVHAASALMLPLRIRLALCAGFIQFGSCSVLLQTASQIRISFTRYGCTKLVLMLCSAVLTYFLTPLFCPERSIPTFADRTEIAGNSIALFSVTLSAALGLLTVFVLTFGLAHRKKAP